MRARFRIAPGALLVFSLWACSTADVDPSEPEPFESSSSTNGSGGSAGLGPEMADTPAIVVDQFGYRPTAEKIAVLRSPEIGFDGDQHYEPGSTLALIDAEKEEQVFSAPAQEWSGGVVHDDSGDRAWWFDFSEVDQPGTYYVLDVEQDVVSATFEIREDVYRDVLVQALRTFFYQRAGFAKQEPFAESAWADGASHVGRLQDANCRRYDAMDDSGTERDLHGGWYDAGDYNKYTSWSANYIVALLNAYVQAPSAFGDDFQIPESDNDVPDILDEVRWGMDWLARMQNDDGSVLSIVGLANGSPPSTASEPSAYGTESTSASLVAAGAFARGATVLREVFDTSYADDLLQRAQRAWDWADANPGVLFYNNDAMRGTEGLGSGQQETNDYQRAMQKLQAAVYLFEASGDTAYRDFFDQNYSQAHLIAWGYAYPFEARIQGVLLHYAALADATEDVAKRIRASYASSIDGERNLRAHLGDGLDPYLAHLDDYVWGSNSTKADMGNLFYDLLSYEIDESKNADAERAAERYLHYLHGTNPLGKVYLSNMAAWGAENSVDQFFHSWFADGSDWDSVSESRYGPPPGFLVGGPNPSFEVDECCESWCSSDRRCSATNLTPPFDQPAQKSYRDFNSDWPANSWSVTENSNGYQVAYIRLLSKFVR